MEEKQDYREDIASIRELMERSTRFISLSGMSGILAGIYALLGAGLAYSIIPDTPGPTPSEPASTDVSLRLAGIAGIVLVLSIATGIWLTSRKARQRGVQLWGSTSRRLLINLAIPLVTGGLFIIILTLGGHYAMIAPSFLIFYGLALINASPNLVEEVRNLGYSEIITGLLCALVPSQGLVFWAIGFGVFHIVYGALMYRKYDVS